MSAKTVAAARARVRTLKKQTTKKGRVLETTMLPVIEKSYHDRYIFTIESDRLAKYYCLQI